VPPRSATIQDVRQGLRSNDRDRESRGPSSAVESPVAPTYDENAALRVGRTLFVKGEITAAEDLLIRGRVIGSIHVDGHVLTIGHGGNVNAEIVAPKMVVQGYVAGNIELTEQLVIAPGGMVVGDVTAPSIVVQDGGTLRQIPDEAVPEPGDEPAPAPTASRTPGQTVAKDGSAQDPPHKLAPRERAAERGRGSQAAA